GRDAFEELLGALARAGYLRLIDAVFEKDGKQIPFRKVYLTRDGEEVEEDTPLGLRIKQAAPERAKDGRRKATKKSAKKAAAKRPSKKQQPEKEIVTTPPHSRAEEMLRAWRLGLAKRQGVPAFRIMSDKVLGEIAARQPKTAADLLAIPGIGIGSVEKYGAQIYRILNEARS
ncbi:MAG TPA: HRDC domain-containing protein, partial [Bryobacteraceae bacterium]|nr:HRDC domain-containing protein [Bryobacteraceae bacterium]